MLQAPLELWQRVADNPDLLERVSRIDPQNVGQLARIRKSYTVEQVGVAIELVAARQKLSLKFGKRSDTMVADVSGAEQASSFATAEHKARRFAETLDTDRDLVGVADLCCGIGGDTLGLVKAKIEVRAVDRSPHRCWMAAHNTRNLAAVEIADVEDFEPRETLIHLDPARRSEATGHRRFKLDDYQPGPAVIDQLINNSKGAAIKLSPGIDLDECPWAGEIEFICETGRLVQAILWTGRLKREERSATLLVNGQAHSLAGSPAPLPLGEIQKLLYTVDPAAERAELIGNLATSLNIHAVHPKLGLLTANAPIASPWLTGFEVIEQMPWREKKVRQWLAANDCGIVEVKTRGKAVDPDAIARQLRGKGATPYTVFIYRWDAKKIATITRRLSDLDAD